ncbi:hypothetical protein CGZ93_05870 [Enemella dayhoffiae]|uniref:Transcriptional regulator, AbiEi antitoxin, Type IV TA system n=1 Tax=Enemella dayhoffiae TaxID=2016507 RepID=A0A255H7D0_9ACTN|nr:hypothetical protein [Enemella dayhoffiae]OYO23469.1 hypothetical protein CGZ93_05870 [Enemella dayhoffiae]
MPIIRREYLDRGHSPTELAASVRRGQLVRLRRGGYAEPNPLATPEQRHRELPELTLPSLGSGSVLSHATAGVLHGLWLPANQLRRVHVCRDGKGGASVTRHLHVHRPDPESSTVPVPDGELRMTDLLGTTVALLRQLPIADAVGVADSALRQGLDPDELLAAIAARKRIPGNRLARRAAEFADPLSESRGESWSRWQMCQLGIAAPGLQHEVRTNHGEHVARCDFWWQKLGLVGEFDGAVKYGRLLKPRQSVQDVVLAEKHREEAIRRQGLWVVRWTWSEVRSDKFGEIISSAMRNAPRVQNRSA